MLSGWRRVNEEGGLTMVELVITLTMLLLVVGTLLGVVESVNRGVIRQQDRSISNDQVRLAVEQLDREIRSGNVLYDPALETPPGLNLRIYTQANANTRNPSFQCVQWLIRDHQLLRRAWPPGSPQSVGDWRTIAEDVVNTQSSPAFALDADPNKGGRTVDITLLVNSTPNDPTNRTVRIETSITGRNTSFGFPVDVCNPAPAP